jgi:APA family basic amino acid/polyamine antiporter
MAFVTLFYIAIQLGAQGLLGPALATSKTPLADGMATIDPRLGLLLLFGAVLSYTGFLGGDLLGAPRVLFAFARDGYLPAALGRVSRTHVPANAIVTEAVLAAALALTGAFEQLVVLSSLAGCALYVLGCGAAWRLRQRDVALAGMPLRLPWLGFWSALGIGSMLVVIALARWAEIGGLVAVILLSCVIHALTAGRRRKARSGA